MVRVALAISFLATASSFLAPSPFLPKSPQHAKSSLTTRRIGGGHQRRRGAALAVDLSGIIGSIDAFYRSSPLQAAFLTCGFKASCSDAISQKSIEVDHPFCWSRNFAFILYGAIYQGCIQEVIYNQWFPILFGNGIDPGTVAAKVLFDQLFLMPFSALPVCYLVKAAVFRSSLRQGFKYYIRDAKKGLIFKAWALWVPTQCVTFTVVPEHLRIAFIAMVSFFWLIILSNISGRDRSRTPSAKGKNIIVYDNEGIIVDEIDDPVDFPQFDFMSAEPTPTFLAAASSAELEASTPSEESSTSTEESSSSNLPASK